MKKVFRQLILVIIFLSIAGTAFAYSIPAEYTPDNTPFPSYGIDENAGVPYEDTTDVRAVAWQTSIILQIIAGALLYFAAPLAILVIVLGAFKLVMGGAETEQVEQGKKQITWAILGLLLIMLSYSLVRILIETSILAGNPKEKTDDKSAASLPQYAETIVLHSLPEHLA
jgi:type IV secretion system pilin